MSELQQLSQAIQNCLRDREAPTQQAAFHQALVEAGLVRQIKTPTIGEGIQQPLIPVQGEAIFQTIVRERRMN